MSLVLLAIGLVLAVEGLVLALAPRRIDEALQMLLALSVERRRLIGLGSLALGVIFVWLAQA